jgi:hypothetical protein
VDEYEPDEYELDGYQLRGHVPKKVPWFGAASMMFGVLAFGAAVLSYQLVSAVAKEHFRVGRGDDGSSARTIYLIAIVITAVPAFGSIVSGFIAVVRGEESLWLLLPGMLWLGLLLLCGLVVLLVVMFHLGMICLERWFRDVRLMS